LQLKWKKGEPGNSQQGKNENSIRPPSAGLLERKVLSFHDSSIESRTPTSFSLSQLRNSPPKGGFAQLQFH
jgi:hypothetical protein